MSSRRDHTPALSRTRLLALCALAVVAGAAIGFVGGAFRWCLDRAGELRDGLLLWSHTLGWAGWAVPVATVAVAAAAAALIVRWMPAASGSGIQHVEAVDRGAVAAPPLRLLPAKFIGGVLALGSGLVLGREGPTVHMGAVIGAETARRGGRGPEDVQALQTSVAGAGLAVAFNAPIGGTLFVFEEVTKSFRLLTVLPTAVAVATAVACARLIIGDRPDFLVRAPEAPGIELLPLFVAFGLSVGILGVVYNRLVMGGLALFAAVTALPAEVKAAAVGALIGLTLWVDPLAAGGGDALSQLIVGGHAFALPVLLGYLAVRCVAGPASYATGVPGGLFAPVLLVGALWGAAFAQIAQPFVGRGDLGVALAVVGMASFFAATVRAPLTGIVIVIEMTAVTSVTVPMLAAAGSAVLVATLLRSAPIYDTLGERMMRDPRITR